MIMVQLAPRFVVKDIEGTVCKYQTAVKFEIMLGDESPVMMEVPIGIPTQEDSSAEYIVVEVKFEYKKELRFILQKLLEDPKSWITYKESHSNTKFICARNFGDVWDHTTEEDGFVDNKLFSMVLDPDHMEIESSMRCVLYFTRDQITTIINALQDNY